MAGASMCLMRCLRSFGLAFRRVVREVNADAWIVGEIWGDARSWLQGDQFDGVMNYRLGWSTLGWAGGDGLRQGYQNPDYPLQPRSSEELLSIWSATRAGYRPEVNRAQLNLLDSHDVPRALHSLNGDLKALKLALLLLFLQPGAPCIYYGTEAGLAGGPDSERSSGPEPACREAFPWDQPWSADLSAYIHQLAELRQHHAVIRQGELSWRSVGSDGLVAQADGCWNSGSTAAAMKPWPCPMPLASAEMLWSSDEAQKQVQSQRNPLRCCSQLPNKSFLAHHLEDVAPCQHIQLSREPHARWDGGYTC